VLLKWYDQKDSLERQNLLKDEETERQREFNANQDKFYELQQDRLSAESGLAETARERRRIELRDPRPRLSGAQGAPRSHRQGIEGRRRARCNAERELKALPGQYKLDKANTEEEHPRAARGLSRLAAADRRQDE
jgi:hypothetical protein